jgi:hypothetical protein
MFSVSVVKWIVIHGRARNVVDRITKRPDVRLAAEV